MLHTKFQGHWSTGSGEEDFLRFLPYMGMAAILVMWPRPFEQFFFPKGPGGCIWNLVAIDPVVSEEKSFEIVDGRRTDGRTTDGRRTMEPAYTISSPGAFGSGELKKNALCRDVINCLKDQSPSYDFWVGRTLNPSPFIYTGRKSFNQLLKYCTCRSVYLLTNKKIQFRPGTCIYNTLMAIRKNQLSLHAARVV